MERTAWFVAWMGGIAVVLLVTVTPPSAIVDHAHWESVTWVPFTDVRDNLFEVAANVLLFVPFGFAAIRCLGPGRGRLIAVMIMGAALSLGVESLQLFMHGRFPSATDLVTNSAGAAVAAMLGQRRAAGRGREVREDG